MDECNVWLSSMQHYLLRLAVSYFLFLRVLSLAVNIIAVIAASLSWRLAPSTKVSMDGSMQRLVAYITPSELCFVVANCLLLTLLWFEFCKSSIRLLLFCLSQWVLLFVYFLLFVLFLFHKVFQYLLLQPSLSYSI